MSAESIENFDFAMNTTYGCGGVAKVAFLPHGQSDACEIYDKYSGENFFVLGNGSNVLAQDGFYDGCVMLTKGMAGIKILENGNIHCDGGVTVARLLNFCKTHGLGGLEYLCGIPATVGGVCFMNAGAAGRYAEENIVNVVIYDSKVRTLTNKECNFAYKQSTMRNIKCLILGCELAVNAKNKQEISKNCQYYLNRRKGLPSGKSCGCVFKNPESVSAGKLIEDAGLKGKAIGCARISDKHANFIIANGTRSQDVYELIAYVKQKVYDNFKIKLEEEVCYIGDFK